MKGREGSRPLSVGFAGNPNCGKSTLFNAFTGAAVTVGNWPGVTVECVEGKTEFEGRTITLTDLPGIYSLSSYTAEEKAAGEWIRQGGADVLINVADGSSLERSLYLTMQLLELGCPVVLALNMMDVVASRGIHIDEKRLSAGLGNIPVIPVSAKKREGLRELLAAAVAAAESSVIQPPVPWGSTYLAPAKSLRGATHLVPAKSLRGATHFDPAKSLPGVSAACDPSPAEIYDRIEGLLARCLSGGENREAFTEKADHLAVHPIWGPFLFWGIMAAALFFTFGVGGAMKGGFERLLGFLSKGAVLILQEWQVSPWLISLITDGAIAGVSSVLTFLPGLAALFLFLAILEDSGYMARAAYVMNETMEIAGLSGRACVPLLLGFGCTVPAVLASRTMEKGSGRGRTIRMIPFMSCSARLPVYLLFSEMFFPGQGALICLLMYALGIGAAAIVAAVSRMAAGASQFFAEPLLLELPDYRLPDVRTTAVSVRTRLGDYLFKAGTTIFSASVVLWFLLHMGPSGYEGGLEGSFAAFLGKWLVPFLAPAGLGFWQVGVALIAGIAAKEMVVSGLFVLYGAAGAAASAGLSVSGSRGTALLLAELEREGFGPSNALALMVFCLFYVPCIAALAAIRKETGSWRPVGAAVITHLLIAWSAAVFVYGIERMILS